MNIRSILKAEGLSGKKALLRTDFNVPLKSGKIKDDFKIAKTLPTLRHLLEKKAKIIIITHLGRPRPGWSDPAYSLAPIARRLSRLLAEEVDYVRDITGFEASNRAARMKPGEIIMLDNIRFDEGEEKNSRRFAKKLAFLADIYVNDAFGASHRKAASISAIKNYLPGYAGILLENEIKGLSRIIKPKRPFVAVMGGAKLKTKQPLMRELAKKADHILVGGGLANNFLAASGIETGKSLIDHEGVYFARKQEMKNVITPVDAAVSTNRRGGASSAKPLKKISKSDYIFDIGPATIGLFSRYIKEANTILWNGPLGMFELKEFRHGTIAVGRIIASRSKGRAYGAVGGGETVEALKMTDMLDFVDWVSTGGGAMLSYLSGGKMPGLKGLSGE